MHSPAAVALMPRLAEILRLDMLTADILRMGISLQASAPLLWKRSAAKPCRFADHQPRRVDRLVAIAQCVHVALPSFIQSQSQFETTATPG
jgi:hypothetical protein